MKNHLTGTGALDQDEGNAADLCHRSWLGMAASCESSTHVKRIERTMRLPTAHHTRLRRQRIAHKRKLPILKGQDYAPKECGRVCHVFKSKRHPHNAHRLVLLHMKLRPNPCVVTERKKHNHRQNIKSRRLNAHLLNRIPPP